MTTTRTTTTVREYDADGRVVKETTTVVETSRQVQQPLLPDYQRPHWQPTQIWCSDTTSQPYNGSVTYGMSADNPLRAVS